MSKGHLRDVWQILVYLLEMCLSRISLRGILNICAVWIFSRDLETDLALNLRICDSGWFLRCNRCTLPSWKYPLWSSTDCYSWDSLLEAYRLKICFAIRECNSGSPTWSNRCINSNLTSPRWKRPELSIYSAAGPIPAQFRDHRESSLRTYFGMS